MCKQVSRLHISATEQQRNSRNGFAQIITSTYVILRFNSSLSMLSVFSLSVFSPTRCTAVMPALRSLSRFSALP